MSLKLWSRYIKKLSGFLFVELLRNKATKRNHINKTEQLKLLYEYCFVVVVYINSANHASKNMYKN